MHRRSNGYPLYPDFERAGLNRVAIASWDSYAVDFDLLSIHDFAFLFALHEEVESPYSAMLHITPNVGGQNDPPGGYTLNVYGAKPNEHINAGSLMFDDLPDASIPMHMRFEFRGDAVRGLFNGNVVYDLADLIIPLAGPIAYVTDAFDQPIQIDHVVITGLPQ